MKVTPRICISAFVVKRPQNRVLLIQWENTLNKGCWTFPSGKLEPNETLVQGMKREVQEETGYTCKLQIPGKMFYNHEEVYPEHNQHWISYIGLFEAEQFYEDKKEEVHIVNEWFNLGDSCSNFRSVNDIPKGKIWDRFQPVYKFFDPYLKKL